MHIFNFYYYLNNIILTIDINVQDFISDIEYDLENKIENAITKMNELSIYERTKPDDNVIVQIGSPSHGQVIDSLPYINGHLDSHDAEIVLKASLDIMMSNCLRYTKSEKYLFYQ